jgi:hypothetical protein
MAEGEIGVDPFFEGVESQLLQPADRRLSEWLVREVGEW